MFNMNSNDVFTIEIKSTGSNSHFLQILYRKSAISENFVILTSHESDFWFLRIFLLLAPKRHFDAKMVLLSSTNIISGYTCAS